MEIVLSVGSGSNNKIILRKSGIAEHHANLTFAPGYLMMVEDLGSGTGTFVNNRRIEGKKILQSGDILSFGEHVFPFEEYYPEMLTRQTSSDAVLDSGEDDSEPEALRSENDVIQEETLLGLRGIKRWMYSLQFVKDRQKMQRRWYLVLSGIILLSLVLPWLSWGNPSESIFVVNDKYDPISGVSMFLDLLEVEISGAPLLYILLYGVTLFIFIGVAVVMIFYFLAGINAWKPRDSRSIRRMSQVVLVLYGVNFVLQFMRYIWFWLDGENALTQTSQLMASNISKSRVMMEHLGLGYWLCGFAILLAVKATRNGLWRPNFVRKWATLSFTFWLPFVLMIGLVHTNIGLIEYDINKSEYKSKLGGNGGSFSQFLTNDEVKDRLCTNAPNISNKTSLFLIREWKRAEDGKHNRLLSRDNGFEEVIKDLLFYHSGLWIMMHGLLIVTIVQMFRRRIQGMVTLILSLAMLFFASGMYFFLHSIVYYKGNPSSDFVTIFVGYGTYLVILAALGMVGEQFYFWTNKSDRREKRENLQPLDSLE